MNNSQKGHLTCGQVAKWVTGGRRSTDHECFWIFKIHVYYYNYCLAVPTGPRAHLANLVSVHPPRTGSFLTRKCKGVKNQFKVGVNVSKGKSNW